VNVLALDTSTPRAAVAIATADGDVLVAAADPSRRHGRDLVPSIRALLAEAALSPGALDLIAVGLGPGSYTGLRVGLTAAKALAYALGRPLIGLDSLEAIARNAPDVAAKVAVVADAQRGDLYAADFARPAPGAPPVRVSPTRIEPIASWTARLDPATLVLGPGVSRLPPLPSLTIAAADDPAHWPDGRRLVAMAREAHRDGRRDDPYFLEPLYLRRSAAEDQWSGGSGGSGGSGVGSRQ
jgi:tRNA threonylcarbamoyladenosine biosynthesis protein TsaB